MKGRWRRPNTEAKILLAGKLSTRIADRESPVCLLGMYVVNYRTFLSEVCWGMLRNLNCRMVGKTCWVNVITVAQIVGKL